MLTTYILIPLLSIAPCALWLWYFYSRSLYKRPSLRLIAITFLLGSIATLIAIWLNLLGQSLFLRLFGPGVWTRVLVLFLVVGPVEEFCKLLAVALYAYRRREFDEPLDGVIYSATAALGFAAIENVIYLSQNNPLLVLLRGPLSNPGHALFSSLWGLSLSRAKSAPNLPLQRFPIILRGWLMASLLHSIFDALLLASERVSIILFYVVIAALLALFFWVRKQIRFHRDKSPHREGTMLLQIINVCENCGTKGVAGEPCAQCQRVVPAPPESPICSVCASINRAEANFCLRCGANLKLTAAENLHHRPHLIAVAKTGDESLACILNRNEIFIGRTLNNDFVIDHPSVSKRHAQITTVDGNHVVKDLGSSNGTFINGQRIAAATELEDGCEIRFGRARYVYRQNRAD
ncbi:MAG TPA: PrsW family glutamic-type intramembrane protease [Blastocatellia bacterium]|nr:PrsW family glutamic-type intramembrane protease [Blastocatellia bacterium]